MVALDSPAAADTAVVVVECLGWDIQFVEDMVEWDTVYLAAESQYWDTKIEEAKGEWDMVSLDNRA